MSHKPRSTPSYLKWIGGKSRTCSTLAALAPDDYGTYFEPFVGSGAVFFELDPGRAVISDMNEDLIVAHQQVGEHPEEIMAQLDQWPNTKPHFYTVRQMDPATLTPIERAARLVYLNKTAFRGMWRVNKRGQYNVPYGAYDRPYYNRETLMECSRRLRQATIHHGSYDDVLEKATEGDWVYLDPPYVPDRAWGDFDRYTTDRFGPQAQIDLAEYVGELDERGVRWVLTNSNHEKVIELYEEWFIYGMSTRRDVALDASERNSKDLVISNYALPPHRAVWRVGGRGDAESGRGSDD